MRSQHFGIEKFIALSCFHLFRDVYNFVTSDHTHTHSNKTPRANEEANTTTATKTRQKKVRWNNVDFCIQQKTFAQFSSNHKFHQFPFSLLTALVHFRMVNMQFRDTHCRSIELRVREGRASESIRSVTKSIKTLMWLLNKKNVHICESKHYSFPLSGFVAIKLEILGRAQNGELSPIAMSVRENVAWEIWAKRRIEYEQSDSIDIRQ